MISICRNNDSYPIIKPLLISQVYYLSNLAYTLHLLLKHANMARVHRILLLISAILAVFASKADHGTRHFPDLFNLAGLTGLLLYTILFFSLLSIIVFVNNKLDAFLKKPKGQQLKDNTTL